MAFIVIEGLDGAGKSTQIKYLQQYLTEQAIPFEYLHFPRLEEPVFGHLISKFLRGELGALNEVNPYLVALMYAADRHNAAPLLKQWIDNGKTILADRYVFSNIGYQCAKLSDEKEKSLLAEWILNLEYNQYQIPQPDINIFIDVPFSFTRKSLQNTREGNDRDYLQGRKDIHEADLDFQQKVRDVYLWQEKEHGNLTLINANDADDNMLPPEKIFNKILPLVQTVL